MITSLLISLWAMMAAQREQRQRVCAIVDSTPVSSSKLMLGQWLGLCLITIGIMILIHIITVIRAVSNGAVLEFTPITLHFLIIYLPWSLVMVSVGFVLGKYCSIFISIPAAAGFWFVTVVLSASGTSVTWLPGPWAQLLDVTASTASSSSAIFGFLSLDSLMYNRLFFTAVTLTILTTAALWFKPYRESKISKVLILILVIAIIGTGTAVIGSYHRFNHIQEAVFARHYPPGMLYDQYQNTRDQVLELNSANPTVIHQYQLDLRLKPEEKYIKVGGTLLIQNAYNQPIDRFIFTLDQNLTIDDLTINDQPVEIKKHPLSWYEVKLPQPVIANGYFQMKINYEGQVCEWLLKRLDRDPFLFAFINKQGVLLPPEIYWYPQAGVHRPAVIGITVDDKITERTLPFPADFTLTIEGMDKTVVTNLNQIDEHTYNGCVPTVIVAAGNWELTKYGNVNLYHTKDNKENARNMVEDLDAIYQLVTDYLGFSFYRSMTALVMPHNYYELIDTPPGIIFISDQRLANQSRDLHLSWNYQALFQSVLELWYKPYRYQWRNDLEGLHRSLGLSSYLWSIYREHHFDFKGMIEEELLARQMIADEPDGMGIPFRGLSPQERSNLFLASTSLESNNLWLELDEIRRNLGSTALKQRMQEILTDIKSR